MTTVNLGKPGELFPHIFFELDEYERCYDNDLFSDKKYPFDQDFRETVATGGGLTQEYVPIQQRKPYVQIALGRVIVETVTTHTFGQENFPKICSTTEIPVYPEKPLEESDQELQRFINKFIEKTLLRSVALDICRMTVSMKSSIVLFKVVNGKPKYEVINRKWCRNLEYDEDDCEILTAFDEIKIEWDEEEDDFFWRKRSFDINGEIEYEPIRYEEQTEVPEFEQIKNYTIHNLGYLLAIKVDNTDGESIFFEQIENIKNYSYFCSFLTVGLQRNTNPQGIYMGKRAPNQELVRTDQGLWTFPDGKFTSFQANPMSYQSAQEWEKRLREITLRGCRIVEIPDDNYQSGDAIRLKQAPEENLIQVTRTNIGDKGLVRCIDLGLKALIDLNGATIERNGEKFELEIDMGIGISLPELKEFEVKLEWGEITSPTSKSKNMDVQTAIMAGNSEDEEEPLFSRSTLRNATGHIFKVHDMGKEVIQIEKEKRQRMMNLAITAIIDTCIKHGNIALLLKVLQKVSDGNEDFTDLAGEYGKMQDAINTKQISQEIAEEGKDDDFSGSNAQDDTSGGLERRAEQDSKLENRETAKA